MRLWDARSGVLLVDPLQHEQSVTHVTFSPDGEWLVTASLDGTARLWDARSGKSLGDPLQHEQSVTHVAFSPDGERLATASLDGTARLWDARSGTPLGDPLWHGSYVTHVAFSPDGEWLATASGDGTARLWGTRSGALLREPMRHEGVVNFVAFSPDGERLATASNDKTARLWDARLPNLQIVPEDQLRLLVQLWTGWAMDDAGNCHRLTMVEAQQIRRQLGGSDPIADWVRQNELPAREPTTAQPRVAVADWEALINQPDVQSRLPRYIHDLAGAGLYDEIPQTAKFLRSFDTENSVNLYNAACGYALCANSIQASEGESLIVDQQTQREEYIDLALACLQESIAAGWDDFDHMQQDRDLAVLRDLREFEELLHTPPEPPLAY